jgi:uncharacterized protein
MKLHADPAADNNRFTHLGADYVVVNARRYAQNVLVFADRVETDWTTHDFETLDETDFQHLRHCGAEIVLLGTGSRQRFPPAACRAFWNPGKVALEAMNTPAACRTFNVLVSEGRKVAAALLLPPKAE